MTHARRRGAQLPASRRRLTIRATENRGQTALIGIQLEEHDLIQQFGDQYRLYRQHAAMLVPLPGRKFTGPKDADV